MAGGARIVSNDGIEGHSVDFFSFLWSFISLLYLPPFNASSVYTNSSLISY